MIRQLGAVLCCAHGSSNVCTSKTRRLLKVRLSAAQQQACLWVQLQEAWQAVDGSHLQPAPAMLTLVSKETQAHAGHKSATLQVTRQASAEVTGQTSAGSLHMGRHQQPHQIVGAQQWKRSGARHRFWLEVTNCCVQDAPAFLIVAPPQPTMPYSMLCAGSVS